MHALFRISQILSPPTHFERIILFLCSDLKGIDPKEYFFKPITRAHQKVLNSEIQKYQKGIPCRIPNILKRLYGKKADGTTEEYQLKVAPRLDVMPPVSPLALTLAVIHQLIEEGVGEKAALLFKAQSEDLQNQLYLAMITGKHANILYALGKEFKEEQKQFFLEDALALFLSVNDARGVVSVATTISQSPKNIKELTKALKKLIASKISLSVIRESFEQGNAPPYMMNHIDTLRISACLERREFKRALSLTKRLSSEEVKERAIGNIIFALTDPAQLATQPELLKEGVEEKLKSLIRIGMAGRWYTGVELPFTRQIQEAKKLLPLRPNPKIMQKCEGYIKKGEEELLRRS